MKVVSLLLFGLIATNCCNLAIAQESYKDPDKAYQIAPPAGWRTIPKGNGEVEFRSRIADQNYRPGIWIMRIPTFGKRPLTKDDENEIKIRIAKDRGEGIKFISEEKVNLSYTEAYQIIYEHAFQALQMKTAEAYVIYKGSAYLVGFNTLTSTFEKYFPLYMDSLKSFLPSEVENHGLSLFLKKHAETPRWDRHFEAPDKTFDVRAQSTWVVEDKTDWVIFYPVPQEKQISFSVVKRHKLAPSDLREWETETKGVFVTESEKLGYRFSTFRETSVDSRPGLRADFQREKNGVVEKGIVIRIFTLATDFELNYSVPPDRFDDFLPLFEQFAQSFRVLEKK